MNDMYKKNSKQYMHFLILFQLKFCAPNKGHFIFTYIFTTRSKYTLKENQEKSIAVVYFYN